MVTKKRITERTAAPFKGARVNREAGTIDDVLICGTASDNGRDYPVSMFRRDYAKYEGRPVNCDHSRDATVDRRLGWFSHVKPGPDGRPRGTLNCLKSHPMYERVMEAAERNPALFGFSHVAMCRTKPGASGREVVEAIDEVESVDLVAQPATTKSLFEGRSTVKTTLRAVIESYRARLSEAKKVLARKLLLLAEDDSAMGAMLDTPVESPDDAAATDPDQAIDDAFKQAMHAQVDALLEDSHSLAEFISKIRELYKSRAKILTGKADAGDEGGNEGGGSEEESRRRQSGAIVEALTACEKAGVTLKREDLVIVAAAAPAEREKVAKRLSESAGGNGGGPTSAGRNSITPAVTAGGSKQKVAEATKPPAGGKEFASFIAEDKPAFANHDPA